MVFHSKIYTEEDSRLKLMIKYQAVQKWSLQMCLKQHSQSLIVRTSLPISDCFPALLKRLKDVKCKNYSFSNVNTTHLKGEFDTQYQGKVQ